MLQGIKWTASAKAGQLYQSTQKCECFGGGGVLVALAHKLMLTHACPWASYIARAQALASIRHHINYSVLAFVRHPIIWLTTYAKRRSFVYNTGIRDSAVRTRQRGVLECDSVSSNNVGRPSTLANAQWMGDSHRWRARDIAQRHCSYSI